MPSKKTKAPAKKAAPVKKAPVKAAPVKIAAPSAKKPAPDMPQGAPVFYNTSKHEQESQSLPAKVQGFIEHGLANGQFMLRLSTPSGGSFSRSAFYSSEVKPLTFQLA